VIADKAILVGTHAIGVGAGAVIHPHGKLDSMQGAVVIGEGVVVWEKAVVGLAVAANVVDENRSSEVESEVRIGRNTVVETGAVVQGSVGEGCVLEAGCKISPGARVGKVCLWVLGVNGINRSSFVK
jgi:dynactin-6